MNTPDTEPPEIERIGVDRSVKEPTESRHAARQLSSYRVPARKQHGAAALIVTLMLFLALALALVYANRTLLIDARTTRYQVQSSQAFEAAEAGAEWVTAQLNDPHRIDDTCQTTALTSALNLKDRMLQFDSLTKKYVPRTWLDGGVARPLQIACVRDADGWQCSCPTTGFPHLSIIAAKQSKPAFLVSLQAGSRPGTVQLTSSGCNNSGPACIPGSGVPTESKAQVQSMLAMLPALMTAPAASLTTLGDAATDTGSGVSFGVTNTDAGSGGVTINAGGTFFSPGARVTSASGASVALSIVDGDESLRSLPTDRLFARYFGMDKSTWRRRAGVARISCESDCGTQIEAATAAGASLIWVEGNLATDSASTWGSPSAPLIIVATGDIRLSGAPTVHGVLYGRGIVWNNAVAGTASLHGAAISETDYGGNGSPDLIRDASILHTLNENVGSFVRVPGSWKDF